MKIPAARAIVIKDNQLLVMKRIRRGQKYMVLPGGRIEEGESPEEALLREMEEETSVEVVDPKLVFVEEPLSGRWGTQYIYLTNYSSGKPTLHPQSQEAVIMATTKDIYEPMWFPLEKLPDEEHPFLSHKLCEEILKAHKNGFPSQPLKWVL